ncbi:MAG TPA: cobalamin-binding protein [Candidatus Limnocylindrales bacterium]|nr:cobalamin-binding protein [Candidatus Limnocylindrales bacterium]
MDIRRRAFLGSLLAALLLASCGSGAAPAPLRVPTPTVTASPTATPVTVTDFQGRSVTIAAPPRRIVSIGASNTEFLFALGAGDRVVGVDDFSDEPAAAREIEKVGGVQVNVERVVALRPDLVVTVRFSDGTIEKLAETTTVLVVDPQGLADVAETAILLGKAVGADGEALAADIAAQLDAVRSRTADLSPKPRVFHEVDASDPAKPFTVGPGSFIHELIEIAGGVNVAAGAGSPYPQLSAEELVRSDPEVIVLGDADYGVTAEQVAARPGWGGITAVRTGRIHPISGSLVSRPGPRVGEAALAYARLLHPDAFR